MVIHRNLLGRHKVLVPITVMCFGRANLGKTKWKRMGVPPRGIPLCRDVVRRSMWLSVRIDSVTFKTNLRQNRWKFFHNWQDSSSIVLIFISF